MIGRIQDIHEEYMEKEKLNYRAETDGLTGLYRKEAAFEKMREYMVEAPKEVYYFSLVDLDHFKQINDLHGHQYGDRIPVSYTHLQKRTSGQASAFFR